MSRARNLADLLDASGDVVSGALDNVPPSNDASALTTGTLPIARIADGDITAAKLASTLDLSGKTVTLPAGTGGKVLQVVQAVSTTTATYSNSRTWNSMTSFLQASITPSSSSSKVLVMLNLGKVHNTNGVNLRIIRNGSALLIGNAAGSRPRTHTANVSGFNGDTNHSDGATLLYLDSPATTSSRTYSFEAYSEGSSATYFNRSIADADDTIQYSGRGASSIILMEIGA